MADVSAAEHLISQLTAAQKQTVTAAELQPLLDGIAAEAAGQWPGVKVAATTFTTFLAERLAPDESVIDSLCQLKTDEMYLVCACLEGNEQAIAVFEEEYLPITEAAVARMQSARGRAEDVRQMVYEKLMLREAEQQPRLARYSGRGALKSWLRVTATRTALDLLRGDKKTTQLDDSALMDHLASPGSDQELLYLKSHYRQEFKAAFQQTLATLSSRERNVLRLQLLDGLNIDQVGAIYKVHRATVARWNQKVREKLLSTTRRALLAKLQIDRTEFESIMRLIQSQFDCSICRHLDD